MGLITKLKRAKLKAGLKFDSIKRSYPVAALKSEFADIKRTGSKGIKKSIKKTKRRSKRNKKR